MNPVRVRGKKYRKKPTKSAKVPKADESASLQDTSSQLKRSNSDPASPDGAHKRSCIEGGLQVTKSVARLSPLECLPVEILESIFLYSPNLSLPRASLVLGKKLATEYVKTQLFLSTFPTETGQKSIATGLAENISMLVKGELQSQILGLKWMTPEFVQQMQEHCTVTSIVRFFSQHELGWADMDRKMPVNRRKSSCRGYSGVLVASKEATAEVVRKFYKQQYTITSGFSGGKWTLVNESADVEVELHIGFMHGELNIKITDISADHPQPIAKHSSRTIDVVNECQIPQKYLRGPWSTEKCEHLWRLMRAGARMELFGGTTDNEVAELGLEDAIVEHNSMAIHALIGCADYPRSHYLRPSCRSDLVSGREKRAELFGKEFARGIVRTHHIKIAMDKECDCFIFRSLADSMNLSVDWEDQAIMDWVIRKYREGDDRGIWFEARYRDAGIELPLWEK